MPGIYDPQELSRAIDVVARLTELSGRMAGKGADELAMSQAFDATFAYMVAYLHHLAIDKDAPNEALAKAAAGPVELGTAQVNALRHFSRTLGRPCVTPTAITHGRLLPRSGT
jgi:hypothetical protein